MIWITRPGSMGQALCQRLEALGYQTRQASPIDIVPLTVNSSKLEQLRQANWLIFISPNAVDYYPGVIPKQARLAVVGEATAQTLKAYNYSVDLIPVSYSSDGLLQAISAYTMQNQRVVIVKGEGGQPKLHKRIDEFGAQAAEVAVYKRQQKSTYFPAIYYQSADWVVVTSQSILQSLYRLTPSEQLEQLFGIPLLVSSEKIFHLAAEMKFQFIKVCDSAHRDDIEAFFTY